MKRRSSNWFMILAILCFLAGSYCGNQNLIPAMAVFYTAAIWLIPLGRSRSATAVKALLTIILAVLAADYRLNHISIEPDTLTVEFIDVGQGDSTLVILPDQTVILIDGGTPEASENVISTLRDHQITSISILIGTHPHADHIGGLPAIIDTFQVKAYYEPVIPSQLLETNYYDNLMYQKLKQSQTPAFKVSAGDVLYSTEDCELRVLSPSETSNYEDLNDYSLILKLTYQKTSFLFMADAGYQAEKDILYSDIECNVLKVGHHGSFGSTNSEYLKAADPEIAVLSVGKDNENNLPNESILRRLEDAGIRVYRTDESGNITITSNGTSVKVR